LTEAPIYINDTPDLNVLQLRAISRRLKSTYDIKLVVVDYLQLLRGTGKRYENRQQEISDMSRSLKALARELDVPVLVLSQLNREVENRPNKRPQLSDLRESGAIEQDADVVLLLVRPDYYDPDDRPGMAELNVAKQRNGPVGTAELVFLKEYTRFEDSAPDRLREAEVAEEFPEEEEVVAE
jgi:replicative DNA helicase